MGKHIKLRKVRSLPVRRGSVAAGPGREEPIRSNSEPS